MAYLYLTSLRKPGVASSTLKAHRDGLNFTTLSPPYRYSVVKLKPVLCLHVVTLFPPVFLPFFSSCIIWHSFAHVVDLICYTLSSTHLITRYMNPTTALTSMISSYFAACYLSAPVVRDWSLESQAHELIYPPKKTGKSWHQDKYLVEFWLTSSHKQKLRQLNHMVFYHKHAAEKNVVSLIIIFIVPRTLIQIHNSRLPSCAPCFKAAAGRTTMTSTPIPIHQQ